MLGRYVLLLLISLFLVVPLSSRAQMNGHEGCPEATLYDCVAHAIDMRHVSKGVGRSLLAKIDAAQAAVDRQQIAVALRILEAFIREVGAQAGKHIEPEHAAHMIHHAEMVIDELLQSS